MMHNMPSGHGQMTEISLINPCYTNFTGNKVTAPSASTTLTVGTPYTIQWSNMTSSMNSKLQLYLINYMNTSATDPENLSRFGRIAFIQNTGSFSWDVPRNIPEGESYVIETSFDYDPGHYSYSEPFAIVGAGPNPPVSLDYPDPGVTWGPAGAAAAGVVGGAGVLAAALGMYWVLKKKREKKAEEKREEERRLAQEAKLGASEDDESIAPSVVGVEDKC